VAVVLFEMLAMEPLFPPAENAVQHQMYLRNWSPQKVLEQHLNFPEGVDEILLNALAVDPAKRYDTALEFGEDVIDLAHESGVRLGDQTMIQFIRALRQEATQRAVEPDTSRFRDESRAGMTSRHGRGDDSGGAPESEGELTIITSSADVPAVESGEGRSASASQFYGTPSSGETPQAPPHEERYEEQPEERYEDADDDRAEETFPPRDGAVWDTANQLEPLSGGAAPVQSALTPARAAPEPAAPQPAEPSTDPYRRSPQPPPGFGDTPTDRYAQPEPAPAGGAPWDTADAMPVPTPRPQRPAPTPQPQRPAPTPQPQRPAPTPQAQPGLAPSLGEVLTGKTATPPAPTPGALPPVSLPGASMVELFTARGRHGPFAGAMVEDTAMRSRLTGLELVSIDAGTWEPLSTHATPGASIAAGKQQPFGFLVLSHLLLSVARKAPAFEVMLWAGRNVSFLAVAAERVVAAQLSSPRPEPGQEAVAAVSQALRWPGGKALPIRATWLELDPGAPTLEEVLVAAMDVAQPPRLFRRIDTMRGPLFLRRLPRSTPTGLSAGELQVYNALGRGELAVHEIDDDAHLRAGLRLVARALVQVVRRS